MGSSERGGGRDGGGTEQESRGGGKGEGAIEGLPVVDTANNVVGDRVSK